MSYAVTDSVAHVASGRAEDSIFFAKPLHDVQVFCEKEKILRCRRRGRALSASNARFV